MILLHLVSLLASPGLFLQTNDARANTAIRQPCFSASLGLTSQRDGCFKLINSPGVNESKALAASHLTHGQESAALRELDAIREEPPANVA